MAELSLFLAPESDPRRYLRKPFSFDKFSCFTNGHIAVFTARMTDAPETDNEHVIMGMCRAVYNTAQKRGAESKILPMNQFEPALKECEECQGAGFVCECNRCGGKGEAPTGAFGDECSTCNGSGTLPIHNWKEVKTRYLRCETCLGIGKQPYEKDSKVGATKLQTRYLLAAKTLPNAKVRAFGSQDPALIEFDGGFGLIMPLRY
jgi:DnaJ-class molecular chaperone